MVRNQLPDEETVAIPDLSVEERMELPRGATAVVVVDMQNDFVRPDGALYVEAAQATVQPIGRLLKRARAHGVPIVYTQDTHTEDDREFEIWPRHCVEGTTGWEIVSDLAPRDDDMVVKKNRYDGFYGTSLEHYLSHVWQIESLVIVGTVANICVGQTAASAGLRWYEVVTPADGISALTDFDQAAALRQISMLYNGKIVAHVDDIEFAGPR